ncbi:uncharacterized protein LOC111832461 [Capsella rubella]|uniref:uncharacterized protein LOC111832461 n=1 Tax=Capsella rubella TaxID=81985 RepID=UPI000CD5478B|nr:uncharacterized protein LOC111832461 [Capsella rubella]
MVSFWNQPVIASASWNWRCLLRLRPLAEGFIKCNIGNGLNASFWFDNWTPLGPLIKSIGLQGPCDLRIPLHAKVSDACDSYGWILACPRTDQAMRLHVHLTTISIPCPAKGSDSYDWVVDNKVCNGFSSSKTWEILRPRTEVVNWHNSVWFKGATPKHAFTFWTANLDRLPTRARLVRWGMNLSSICGFCSSQSETRDHLFLSCDFALFLWNGVSKKLDMPPINFGSWNHLLAWMCADSRRAPRTLRKLVVQAIIYAIWRQRNNLYHNLIHVPPSVIFKEVDRGIRNSITARKLNKQFKKLMRLWLH